jgi:predicted small lipoprotein YifL
MKRIALLALVLAALLTVIGCGNKEPVINSFAPSSLKFAVFTGEVTQFSAQASDPDENTTLVYSWAFTSGSPSSAKGASVEWTAPDSPGTAKATLTVSDGEKTVTKTWEITVKSTAEAEVTVQLVKQDDNTPYAISGMRVVLEDKYTMMISVITDSNGKASFPTDERGTFKVVRVEGVDVTGGAEGAIGLEFVKESPLSTAAPKIVYEYSVCPTATVEPANEKVTIQCPIPSVRKVTIMKTGSVDTPDETSFYCYASESFAGRIIISNRNCDCSGGLYIRYSGVNNFMVFNLGKSTNTGHLDIYSGGTKVHGLNNIGMASDDLTIEVPGNGDWAFNANDVAFTRTADGLNDLRDSFVSFGANGSFTVFYTYNWGVANMPPDHYRFEYEVQKFEEL